MKTYFIGRRATGMDIRIDNDSLSTLHAELVVTDDGRYYLTDCGSTNGTFHQEGGQWQPIRQSWVAANQPVMLGSFQTTVQEMLRRCEVSPSSPPQTRP